MKTRVLCFMATGSPVGGVSTWLDQASRELGQRGYDVVVALVRGLQHNHPERFRRYHPSLDTVEVDGRGMDREGRIRACQRTIRKINPRLVLPLGVLDANFAAMRAKCRDPDVRLVGRAQGNLPPMLADLEDLRDGLDHVVCVGAMTRKYLIARAGYSTDRVDHIPNGAFPAAAPRTWRRPGDPIRLGYVGRLMQDDKRVLDIPPFCQALKKLGVPFYLTIVGSGPCEQELRNQLLEFGDAVHMTGFKTGADIYAEVYPRLDLLLLFSSSETFGIVLAEAMMNGVVPVTSRYVGFQSEQLVIEGMTGLSFPVGDPDNAAEAVRQLAENPARLEQLSRAAVEHASTRYTWKACFDRWDRVLQRVLAREGVRPPETLLSVTRRQSSGRLDRLGTPPVVADAARRLRRIVFGAPVPPGGEEWPLFNKHHSAERLRHIHEACLDVEAQAP